MAVGGTLDDNKNPAIYEISTQMRHDNYPENHHNYPWINPYPNLEM